MDLSSPLFAISETVNKLCKSDSPVQTEISSSSRSSIGGIFNIPGNSMISNLKKKLEKNIQLSKQNSLNETGLAMNEVGDELVSNITDNHYEENKNLPKKPKTTFPFGKCKVCTDKATGVHYGVPTCEGCKVKFC
jgi:hypothetical protein